MIVCVLSNSTPLGSTILTSHLVTTRMGTSFASRGSEVWKGSVVYRTSCLVGLGGDNAGGGKEIESGRVAGGYGVVSVVVRVVVRVWA